MYMLHIYTRTYDINVVHNLKVLGFGDSCKSEQSEVFMHIFPGFSGQAL